MLRNRIFRTGGIQTKHILIAIQNKCHRSAIKTEIGSRKEILGAGREIDKLEKKRETEERRGRKALHQSVCSPILHFTC
jgi:hypothetical protein